MFGLSRQLKTKQLCQRVKMVLKLVGVPRFSEDLACKISQQRRGVVYNEEAIGLQLCSSTLQTSYTIHHTFPGTLSSCLANVSLKKLFFGQLI